MRNSLAAFLFLILCSGSAFSQITVKASVDKNKVGLGETFQADYSVEGGNANFTPPAFSNFNVLGQSTMSGGGMTVIVNGKVISGGNSGTTFSYTLSPKAIGKFSIEPGSATANGKTYKSEAI